MADDNLYQKCLCWEAPRGVSASACSTCRGKRFLETGLTLGQFEMYRKKAECVVGDPKDAIAVYDNPDRPTVVWFRDGRRVSIQKDGKGYHLSIDWTPLVSIVGTTPPEEPVDKHAAQAALDADSTVPPVGAVFEHYKGGFYSVVATSIMEATGEILVTYHSNLMGTNWTRTLENWNERVTVHTTDAVLPRNWNGPRFSRHMK